MHGVEDEVDRICLRAWVCVANLSGGWHQLVWIGWRAGVSTRVINRMAK